MMKKIDHEMGKQGVSGKEKA